MTDGIASTLPEDDDLVDAIINGRAIPLAEPYRAGFDAHAAGESFHKCPRPKNTASALSWRIGWNDRALQQP